MSKPYLLICPNCKDFLNYFNDNCLIAMMKLFTLYDNNSFQINSSNSGLKGILTFI